MSEADYFCNNWECEYRKNNKYKAKTLCDLVWIGCPYDDEFYKSLRWGGLNDRSW